MAIVTGTLTDFGIDSFDNVAVELEFHSSMPAAVGGSHLYVRRAIPATFTTGGQWSVDLAPNETLNPATYYTATVTWLNGGSIRTGYEFVDLPLYVPVGGGEFAALVKAPTNPAQIWFGPEPPTDPTRYTGWYDTDALPGQPNYFEWE